ncbi:MAG: diphthamide synthesis protein [Nanoarchaeota archaeon]|nr:diphthamide synthesis protein [Nanoarchaeota archaeon]
MEYDLELDKVVDKINKERANLVCIQLPDGLKPKAKLIQNEIENKTRAKIIIWAGSCFGACDIPLGVEKLGVDLLIQFGHSPWQ